MICPCEDCITLAMCLGNLKPKYSGTALWYYIDINLLEKCSILKKFMYESLDKNGEIMSSSVQHKKIMDFYKLKLWGIYPGCPNSALRRKP
ncbi:MAG: hypothetical protein ACTSW1_07595 [Candidatus Hodarchaeales archaeon]